MSALGSRSSTASSTAAGPSAWSSRFSGSSAFPAPVIVGLYRAPLDVGAELLRTFAATLSAQERARADAARTPRLRERFIADHGWRRRLLAERIGRAPGDIAYVTGERGKPRLVTPGPHFSAARSDDVAWYALCDRAEVGVDVERVDGNSPLEPRARRLLTPRERAIYDALPQRARAAALTACWTCKEAAGKALGGGLVFPLTALEAWTADGAPVRTGDLETRGLAAGEGREAAVAVRVTAGEAPAIAAVVDLTAS